LRAVLNEARLLRVDHVRTGGVQAVFSKDLRRNSGIYRIVLLGAVTGQAGAAERVQIAEIVSNVGMTVGAAPNGVGRLVELGPKNVSDRCTYPLTGGQDEGRVRQHQALILSRNSVEPGRCLGRALRLHVLPNQNVRRRIEDGIEALV
jgi:hypothetical protein